MKAFTIYELAELVSCGDLQRFTLPRAFLVANLVVYDLSVLSVSWRGLPSHHEALHIQTFKKKKSSHKSPVYHCILYSERELIPKPVCP